MLDRGAVGTSSDRLQDGSAPAAVGHGAQISSSGYSSAQRRDFIVCVAINLSATRSAIERAEAV